MKARLIIVLLIGMIVGSCAAPLITYKMKGKLNGG